MRRRSREAIRTHTRTLRYPDRERRPRGRTSASRIWKHITLIEFDGTAEIADALASDRLLHQSAAESLSTNGAAGDGNRIDDPRLLTRAAMDTDSTSGANGNLFGMYTYSETSAATGTLRRRRLRMGRVPRSGASRLISLRCRDTSRPIFRTRSFRCRPTRFARCAGLTPRRCRSGRSCAASSK